MESEFDDDLEPGASESYDADAEADAEKEAEEEAPGDDRLLQERLLIFRIQEGREAEGKLAELYRKKLRRWVIGKRVPASEADDVVQETLLKAYDGIHTYKPMPGKTFWNWLVEIAQNVIKDRREGKKRLPIVEVEDPDALAPAPTQAGLSQGQINVPWALERLPFEERTVMVLHWDLKMTVVEISEKLLIPAKEVNRLENRAIRRMHALSVGEKDA